MQETKAKMKRVASKKLSQDGFRFLLEINREDSVTGNGGWIIGSSSHWKNKKILHETDIPLKAEKNWNGNREPQAMFWNYSERSEKQTLRTFVEPTLLGVGCFEGVR